MIAKNSVEPWMISQPPSSQPEPVRGEQREERAEHRAVVDEQHRGRHAEREAEREGEDRDLALWVNRKVAKTLRPSAPPPS